MVCKIALLSVLFVTILWTVVIADDDEEMCNCVLLGITDDVESCSGLEDIPVDVKLKMQMKEGAEDMPDMVELVGDVDVGQELGDAHQINININLETPNGKELVWSGGADMCQSMSDTDAPWFPLLKAFNTTECPIDTGVYPVEGMTFSLDFAGGFLTKDFCGSYSIAITMENMNNMIMCFQVGAEIFEEERACSLCPKKSDDDK